MNVCIMCVNLKYYPGPGEYRCHSLEVRKTFEQPVTGVPESIYCNKYNKDGTCEYWEQADMVLRSEYDTETKRLQAEIKELQAVIREIKETR